MSDLQALVAQLERAVAEAADSSAVEALRVQFLGKKSQLSELSKQMGKLADEQRRVFGAELNAAREAITSALNNRKQVLDSAALDASSRPSAWTSRYLVAASRWAACIR